MLLTVRTITAASVAWVIVALFVQYFLARKRGSKDYSTSAGGRLKGVIYNFTWAMAPGHKETLRLHPVKSSIGILMHVGVLVAVAYILVLAVNPQHARCCPYIFGVIPGIAALCAFYLLVRRVFTPEMRAMSSPDDYLSIMLTFGLLIAAVMHEFSLIGTRYLLGYAAVLFFYLPIGKLKHALFFFLARADFGARMGYRGTYPAGRNAKE